MVVFSLEFCIKHNLSQGILALQCAGLKPPRELKEIFDQDTGSIYFDPTDMTRLMILADNWIGTMRNRIL